MKTLTAALLALTIATPAVAKDCLTILGATPNFPQEIDNTGWKSGPGVICFRSQTKPIIGPYVLFSGRCNFDDLWGEPNGDKEAWRESVIVARHQCAA